MEESLLPANDSSGAPPSPEAHASLLTKYRRLCEKYERLVEKLKVVTLEKIAVFQLGWWTLRTSASALALVRDGTVELTNQRWQDLERGPDGLRKWHDRVAADAEATEQITLRDLAVLEARKLLDSGAASRVVRYRRQGGQIIEVRLEQIANSHQLVALLVHDVTEQVHAEEELRLAREALHHRQRVQVIGELVSGIAHDLNNAFNVMRLRLELLGRDRALPATQRANVEALARIVSDAATRVTRMQQMARKQREEGTEILELKEVVADALALVRTELEQRAAIGGKQISVVAQLPELPAVRADAAELKHVLVNLFLNARDAMPEGGALCIEGRIEQDNVVLAISDEGTGIPAELMERIFEPFFTTKGGRRGTGLGLSMARGAMARMGGSIQARNRDGRGAEFLLRFPVAPEAPPRAAAPPRAEPAPAGPALRILLVDDEPDALEVTQAVLQQDGLEVDTARSGADALARLQDRAYDVLLCDVGMPEMSGWEVAEEARRRWPRTPVYMVTGWATEFPSNDPRRRMVDGILAKPMELDELRSILRRIPRASPQSERAPPAR